MASLLNHLAYCFMCLSRSVVIILLSVLRQVHILVHSEFPPHCDLVLPISISSILSFLQGHPVDAYVFFLVFPPLILPSLFPSMTYFRRQFLRNI